MLRLVIAGREGGECGIQGVCMWVCVHALTVGALGKFKGINLKYQIR